MSLCCVLEIAQSMMKKEKHKKQKYIKPILDCCWICRFLTLHQERDGLFLTVPKI